MPRLYLVDILRFMLRVSAIKSVQKMECIVSTLPYCVGGKYSLKSVVSGQWSVISGQWSVISGQWSVVSGQWSVVSGQWSVVSGQWSVVSDS